MYDFGNNFHIKLDDLKAKDDAIILGQKYRFTVLTERLIRLEYSPSFVYNDLKTEFVSFRNFDVPKFDKREDETYLEIETDYFKLSYSKEQPFKGSIFNPTKNLKIEVKGTNAVWYYGCAEAKNYYGSNVSTETKIKKNPENKGLYSLDGMVSFDDSNNYRISEKGSIEEPIKGNIDIYVFIYKVDFGLCVQDYFKLTGLPALIPRYALGNWWSRDKAYTQEEMTTLVEKFEKREIPLSVFVLEKVETKKTLGQDLHLIKN